MSARLQSARGFTLIEVLVAVSLLASLGIFLYASFGAMIRSQEDTDRLQERHHAARVSMSRMTREISMAFLSKHVNDDEARSKTLFLGDRNRITFTSFSNQRRVRESMESDQLVIEYFLKSIPRGRGKGLYRRTKSVLDDKPEKGGTVELMAEGVKSLEFEYWNRKDEDWDSNWEVTSDDFELLGPAALATGKRKLSEEVTDEDETLQLPWRVLIRLELIDEEKVTHLFETQTPLYVREPLDFTLGGALTNAKGRLNSKGRGGKGRGGSAGPTGGGR
jgi:general secretion pathway protein J